MIHLLISGIDGAMGKALQTVAAETGDIRIAAGIDRKSGESAGVTVYSRFEDCGSDIDVVVDFSHPSALDSLIRYCEQHQKPAVLCTTGYTPDEEKRARALADSVPVFRSANMALGVNLIAHLAKTASLALGGGFDVEIVEKHHRKKADAPSGTAMMLANVINDANGGRYRYVYERQSVRESRREDELGIHAVRGGTIVGEHEILFAGSDEVITISHSAMSKNVFASGAIAAARFLIEQPPGFYNMDDLIKQGRR